MQENLYRWQIKKIYSISDTYLNLLPVKTRDSVPKEKIFEIMEVLDDVKVKAPVNVGDIIVENVLGIGVDIVATKTLEAIL
ncbi:DUF1667 domain-containing protein [Romboutsia maritimum]|uniref:DUF1667 domain-containing protein n=1 Tax=Romboutsia maritimum TaxID=2020948 RepID=A0A371ISP8_9FIRM|nr:DUF1667 domain-containing protein [Romboutsia maritimum]RDY23510.1 DUF1667 domain-containing protein [Romboutsia maritimum]